MQTSMNICTKLHEATVGKTQQEKILLYCWWWKKEKGEKVIEDIEDELIVHGD